MKKWMMVAGGACVLAGACILREEGSEFGNTCEETRRECNVGYSDYAGYFRTCSTIARPCLDDGAASNEKEKDDDNASSEDGESASAPPPSSKPDGDVGTATPEDPERYSAFDIQCERDSQCGPGKCIEGECFYGCHSDAQCGSGDRCAVESGTRICRPDPNPVVECTRAAQCAEGSTCLNGSCRQTCSATEQCENVVDRCTRGICEPDRRPLGECVLNIECAEGFVCLDGACVPACTGDGDGSVCVQESRGNEGDTTAEPQTPGPDDLLAPRPTPSGDDDTSGDQQAPADAGTAALPVIE